MCSSPRTESSPCPRPSRDTTQPSTRKRSCTARRSYHCSHSSWPARNWAWAAALELVTAKADKKAISYTFYTAQSDSVAFQLQIAEAAMMIDTAHLHAYRAADDLDRAAQAGVYPDVLVRTRVRADTAWVLEHITKAIDLLLFAHGAGSFADTNPLQRLWRDSAVAARHAVTLPAVNYEVYGKALLGREDQITPLI